MAEPTDTHFDRASRYLDGDMSEAERADFERDLAVDGLLKRAVERLHAVHERAQSAFDLPDAPPTTLKFESASPGRSAGPSRRSWLPLALAAALVVGIGLAGQMAVNQFTAQVNRVDGADLYRVSMLRFTPEVICDTPEKFSDYTRDVFGVAITHAPPGEVGLVGWTAPLSGYDPRPGAEPVKGGPRVLLTEAPDGTRLIVLFQDDGVSPSLPEASDLRVFHRGLAGVDVYEITPLAEPIVLDLLMLDDG